MMKRVILVLLVFMLVSNALAYDYHKSVANGYWRSGSTWDKGTRPIDRSDVAEIINGYTVTVATKFTTTTAASTQIRKIYVGKNGSNGTLDILDGALLRSSETHIGSTNTGVQWTVGKMYVRYGGTYHTNDGFNTGKTYVGSGVGSKGFLDIAGTWVSANDKPTSGFVTVIGNNNADLGVWTVRASADIDINGGFTTSGSNSVLAFRTSGNANFDVTDQVVIADGTIFDLESDRALGGPTTFDILRSATGISINLANVTVVGSGTLSLNGNTLQMTVPEPMTISFLGLGAMFLYRRKR